MNISSQIIEQVLKELNFGNSGLIPAIAQDSKTGDVLMLAYMNSEAVCETLSTGHVCYWSRSRNTLWRKGETSGHIQTLVEFHYDCDSDALLLKVMQKGPACHTGRPNCFYKVVHENDIVVISDPISD